MVTGKMKYRRKKLTIDQKALKQAITPLVKELKASIKADAPTLTGALKASVDYRLLSKRGWTAAVIGVKSHYQRTVNRRTEIKLPNLYALKVGMKEVIAKYVNAATVDRLYTGVKAAVKAMLKKGGK